MNVMGYPMLTLRVSSLTREECVKQKLVRYQSLHPLCMDEAVKKLIAHQNALSNVPEITRIQIL
jgi:hypothetical protein